MSLMDAYKDECVLLVKTRIPDGQGGYSMTGYTDGITFSPAWEYESSPEMLVAEKEGVSRVYRLYVDKALDLEEHEVFRRIKDGQVFRVTNPGTDRHTPDSSMLNKRLIEVEKYTLPHEFGGA